MNKENLKNKWLFIVVMTMTIILGINKPISVLSQTTVEQEQQLAEVKKIDQEIVDLFNQGKFYQAIPLAQKALEIRKKILGAEHPDVAASLNNLAELYLNQGEYDKAEPFYLQALELRKKLFGNNHADVAISLQNLASFYTTQGKYSQAEPLYKQALKIYREQLGQENLYVATNLHNLAFTYLLQKKYSKAEPLFKEALEINKKQLGESHPSVANNLNSLAVLYQGQGKYSKAEPLFKEALEINKKQLGESHPSVATNLNDIGVFYEEQGRYSEAESFFKEALEIYKKQLGESHPSVATNLNNIASIYQKQGRYAEAEPLFLQVLELDKKVFGKNHPLLATHSNNLALLYQEQGRYSEAESLFQEALELRIKVLGENHLDVVGSINNLALLYQAQGRYFKAEPRFKKSLNIYKQQLGEKHPLVAISLNNLAVIYQAQGRYSEAEPLFKESLNIYKTQLREEHPLVIKNFNNLALNYKLEEKYAKAKPFFLKALELEKKVLGEKHPSVAITFNNLALFSQAQNNINSTVDFLNQALEIEEYNLSKNILIGSEKQKLDYVASIASTLSGSISLHLQSAPSNKEINRLALTTILRRKGRILDFMTNSLETLRQQTDNQQTQDLLTRLISLRTQQSNLVFRKPVEIESANIYRQNLIELETKTKQLEDKLSRRSAEFRALSQIVSLEKIQENIPNEYALLELAQYRPLNLKAPPAQRFGKTRYAAYTLRNQGEPQAIDLGEAETIEKAVTKFQSHLQNRQSNIDKQLKASGRELDELVMKPIRQLLGDKTNILISPDRVLNLIPFEALVDENNQYLVENYNFTYLTSGRDLLRITAEDKPTFQQPGMIMADPLYNREGKSAAQTRTFDISKLNFERLDGTAAEAEAVFSEFSDANQPLTRSFATKNALKQVKQPQFLHIATHGFFVDKQKKDNFVNDNPLLRSGLVFAGVKKASSNSHDNGILTALEATTLDLRGTQLVVLSACDTGIGDVTIGEGIYGLRRAFVLAGSESQVISLWKVDDSATKELMVNYYRRLKNNEGRSLALHEVQREMLKSEDYQHPYYWASFIPSGDWSEMK
ncbi:MAG: tetratricopeptide repeat protein [Cyanobacteria bacterium P01_G01_bin.39]